MQDKWTRKKQIIEDTSRIGHAMGTHMATNTSRRGIMPSREESSLQDKNGSWSDVTS